MSGCNPITIFYTYNERNPARGSGCILYKREYTNEYILINLTEDTKHCIPAWRIACIEFPNNQRVYFNDGKPEKHNKGK